MLYSLEVTVNVEKRNRVNARWFDIWAAAVAVTTLCLAKGYAGTSGVPTGLSVTVGIGSKGLGLGNETASSSDRDRIAM